MNQDDNPERNIENHDDDPPPPRPDILRFGSEEGETFEGSGGIDLIDAGGGDDVVTRTDARANIVLGGSGDDRIHSTGLSDLVLGGSGNDVIHANGSQAIVFGGTGNDSIHGSDTQAIDLLYGGGGDDIIWGNSGIDIVWGGEGQDVLYGGEGDDTLRGNVGNDVIEGGAGVDSLFGGNGDDIVRGNAGRDVIRGGDGHDVLYGGNGVDWITGDAGNDHISGGADGDVFVFGSGDGRDTIHDFDTTEDRIYLDGIGQAISWEQFSSGISETDDGGSAMIDLADWGGGTITLTGVTASSLTSDMVILPRGRAVAEADGREAYYVGDDLIVGHDGDDSFDAADGHDTAFGAEGNDNLTGGRGKDWLFGGEGDDALNGSDGNDYLIGGEGADTLEGSAGDDWLSGGTGDDTLTGGEGADIFAYQAGQGSDRITDFTDGEDAIRLGSFDGIAGFEDLTIRQVGANVTIDLSDQGGGTITLENLALDALDDTDFVLWQSTSSEPVQDSM